MKKLWLASVFTVLLFSCEKIEKSMAESTVKSESVPRPENLNIQTANFEEIDSTGVLMFPLSMGQNPDSRGAKSYKDLPEDQPWNILFLDTKTHAQHLLTDRKILINSHHYGRQGSEADVAAPTSKYIFYSAKTDDFNQDKLLTEDDPNYLFVSDKAGYHFRQISPKNQNIASWTVLPQDRVVMTAYRDTNCNQKFDEQDESSAYEVILSQKETPTEIISAETRQTIRKLYDRDWKKIK